MHSSTRSSSRGKHRCHTTQTQVITFLSFSHLTGHSSPPSQKQPQTDKGEHRAGSQTQIKRSEGSRQQTWCSCSATSHLGYRIGTSLFKKKYYLQQLEAKMLWKRKCFVFFFFLGPGSRSPGFISSIQIKSHCWYTMKCRWMIEVCS